MEFYQMQLSATPLNANLLKKDEKIVYKNNAILLFKVWRKYEKHYCTGFKSCKRRNNNHQIISSKYAICGDKKSEFIKKQEAKGLLNNPVIRTLLSKILILRDALF